jgi:SPP1 gp7 family putative phage head morphogenesis protein
VQNNYDLLHALSLKPEEAVNYFENKGYTFSFDWKDVWQEAHNKAFTVAKMMKLDLLKDTKDITGKYISGDYDYKQAAALLEEGMKKAGWWGKIQAKNVPGVDVSKLADPEKEVQLGSLRRIKTILETNNNISLSAGRYRQMVANAKERPYWQYIQLDRPTKRAEHAKLHGRVFRWDDPIWDTIWPPNGWHCLCYIKPLTEAEFKPSGLKLSTGSDVDFKPQEGWAYNPGKTSAWDTAEKKEVPGKTWKELNRPDIRNLDESYFHKAPKELPEGKNLDEALAILKEALGISEERKSYIIKTPVDEVIIDEQFLSHMVEKRSNRRERYANFIIPTLEEPFEIYLRQFEDGYRPQYIGLFQGKHNILISILVNKDGSFLYNYMQASNAEMNRQRKGELIWPK